MHNNSWPITIQHQTISPAMSPAWHSSTCCLNSCISPFLNILRHMRHTRLGSKGMFTDDFIPSASTLWCWLACTGYAIGLLLWGRWLTVLGGWFALGSLSGGGRSSSLSWEMWARAGCVLAIFWRGGRETHAHGKCWSCIKTYLLKLRIHDVFGVTEMMCRHLSCSKEKVKLCTRVLKWYEIHVNNSSCT